MKYKSKYNYSLFEVDSFGNKKCLKCFYTLEELDYYMKINNLSICDLVNKGGYYPLYKYRVYSYKLNQFI